MLFTEGESRFGILDPESGTVLTDRDHDDNRYNRIKMSRIESLRGDGMTCHVIQCCQAGFSDVAILPDLNTYKQAMKQLDASSGRGYRTGVQTAGWPRGVKYTCYAAWKKKRTVDGELERYKACLFAQGLLQAFGVDFFDTYAPVARLTFFFIIYGLYVTLQYVIDNKNVDVAFPNATL